MAKKKIDPKGNTDSKGKRKENSGSQAWITDLRYGQSISVDFFKKNAWILIVFLIVILSLIGLRYKNKTQMREIKILTDKLELAESEKLQEKAAYMTLIRETEMRRMVAEKNLGLVFQEQPPYEIELIEK